MSDPLLTEDDRDALRDWWDEDETAGVESSFPIIARILERVAAEAEASARRRMVDEMREAAEYEGPRAQRVIDMCIAIAEP